MWPWQPCEQHPPGTVTMRTSVEQCTDTYQDKHPKGRGTLHSDVIYGTINFSETHFLSWHMFLNNIIKKFPVLVFLIQSVKYFNTILRGRCKVFIKFLHIQATFTFFYQNLEKFYCCTSKKYSLDEFFLTSFWLLVW